MPCLLNLSTAPRAITQMWQNSRKVKNDLVELDSYTSHLAVLCPKQYPVQSGAESRGTTAPMVSNPQQTYPSFLIPSVLILAFVFSSASSTENRCCARSQWYREEPRPGEMDVGVVDRCDNCPSLMMSFAGDLQMVVLFRNSQPSGGI